jgi:hypothetical protein
MGNDEIYKVCFVFLFVNVPVNSNCDHPPPGRTPGNLTFQKKFGQISHCAGENHRQIPRRPGLPDIHDCLYFMCTGRTLYH